MLRWHNRVDQFCSLPKGTCYSSKVSHWAFLCLQCEGLVGHLWWWGGNLTSSGKWVVSGGSARAVPVLVSPEPCIVTYSAHTVYIETCSPHTQWNFTWGGWNNFLNLTHKHAITNDWLVAVADLSCVGCWFVNCYPIRWCTLPRVLQSIPSVSSPRAASFFPFHSKCLNGNWDVMWAV